MGYLMNDAIVSNEGIVNAAPSRRCSRCGALGATVSQDQGKRDAAWWHEACEPRPHPKALRPIAKSVAPPAPVDPYVVAAQERRRMTPDQLRFDDPILRIGDRVRVGPIMSRPQRGFGQRGVLSTYAPTLDGKEGEGVLVAFGYFDRPDCSVALDDGRMVDRVSRARVRKVAQ
jgi:hypothetical protein